MDQWINAQGFKSDIVSYVTGAQMKEQKFHPTNLFVATTKLPNLSLASRDL
jgi:hypothetical protein